MIRLGKCLWSLRGRKDGRPQEAMPHSADTAADDERLEAIRLRELVEGDRLYLWPDISLQQVAHRLETDCDTLSRAFGHHIGADFDRYVNELRIMHAAALFMSRDSHLYAVDRIALQCGFRDSETFCCVCRDLTGMTPDRMRDFANTRKTLVGLFRDTPICLTAVTSDSGNACFTDEAAKAQAGQNATNE